MSRYGCGSSAARCKGVIGLQYSPFGSRPADLATELERRKLVYEAELAQASARLSALRVGNAELRRYGALLEQEWLHQRHVKEELLNALTDRNHGQLPDATEKRAGETVTAPPPNPGSLPAMEQELSALRAARQEILSGVLSLILPFLGTEVPGPAATSVEMGDTNG